MAHGVGGIIAVGCDPATNVRTLEVASQYDRAVWPCLGAHPKWTELSDGAVDEVERQVAEHHLRIVALGEIGLPWYCLKTADDPASLMIRGLERLDHFLILAVRYDLPVILHAPHGAAAEALVLLKRHRIERAVFHWHKAPFEITRQIVEAEYLVSVTPEVVYRGRDREMVEQIPLESLLVETDSLWPYQGEFDGIPTEPWMAARVVEEIARLKQLPVDVVTFQVATNTRRLFRLPPPDNL
jgi:TatD DNase family protein